MGQYVPGTQDPELARISQALSSPNDAVLVNVLYKAPAKTKPGTLVVADGTSWNPGSGAGLYLRNAANNAWLFIADKATLDVKAPLASPSFTTTIGVGATAAAASGAGISFPATQSPSTDVNTLDDYEEGTWTPSDASGAGLSFTVNSATYTKIGRCVYVSCYIIYPATANGSTALIGGLPFAAASVQVGTASATNGTSLVQSTDGTAVYPIKNGGVETNASLSGLYLIIGLTYFI